MLSLVRIWHHIKNIFFFQIVEVTPLLTLHVQNNLQLVMNSLLIYLFQNGMNAVYSWLAFNIETFHGLEEVVNLFHSTDGRSSFCIYSKLQVILNHWIPRTRQRQPHEA